MARALDRDIDRGGDGRAALDVVPRSIGRVLDVLEIVLAGGSCNLTTVATRSGLTPTTALRHLRALEARRYIERDGNGRFSAGPTLMRVTASLRGATSIDYLVAIAQPHLDALARRTRESTYLAVGDRTTATYVATAGSDRAIRHVGWVGQNVPLKGTAVGAALASPGRCATKTGAVEPDITAISLALPGDSGKPLRVAVSVIGPKHRLRPAARGDVEVALVATVARLSRELGRVTDVATVAS
jgi:IclR family transcriptional regulator, KDG regulon repressor